MRASRSPAIALLSVALLVTACATGASVPASSTVARPSGTAATQLTVYAAASLKDALTAVASAYERAVPAVRLTIATDASSTLRAQIEQGAPADVFLSADESNPAALVKAGLADGAAVPFAGNRLTVIVPASNAGGIDAPADLVNPGVKVIAAGDGVPISAYTSQVIDRLAALPGYGPGFPAAYRAHVVSKEDNVRSVVAKIELGEGDGAIVYATDALASTKVRTVEIPAAANVSARYAGVVVANSKNAAAAHALLDWLAGDDGQAALALFGFAPPT